jgi:SOS-response transcriptional repressor LexA
MKWAFMQRAGLDKSDVLAMLPELELPARPQPKIEVFAATGEGLHLKRKSGYIAVPLLVDPAAAGEPRLIDDNQVEDMIIVRGALCPHPEQTVCVKVKGDSMSPVLLDGYVVAIDTTITERKALYRQMVAAIGPSDGCTIKWLRKSGKDELLVPQHTTPFYDPIVITNNPEWRIIGKILWWLGHPPAFRK